MHRTHRSPLLATTLLALVAGPLLAANSNGRLGDPKLDRIHRDAVRFYDVASDTAQTYLETVLDQNGVSYQATVYGTRSESVRPNALGDEQVLYYDYYPPLVADASNNKVCAIFFHGGGYTVGYANQGHDTEIRPLRERGFHVVSVEYRRGWFGDGSTAPGGEPELSALEGTRFSEAVELALTDAQDAWTHVNTNRSGHARFHSGSFGFPKFARWYLIYGFSAGGSLASRLALTQPIPTGRTVVGAIVGYGTHAVDEPVVNLDVPVLIQGGLFDPISPAYDNFIYFDDDAPTAKGVIDLYQELDAGGATVRLLLGAQDGHGRGSYNLADGSPAYVGEAIGLFKSAFQGSPPANYQEFKFRRDARYTAQQGASIPIDDQGALYEQLGPGSGKKRFVTTVDTGASTKLFVDGFVYDVVIDVASGFRYEPVQTDFENGLRPSDVQLIYNLP